MMVICPGCHLEIDLEVCCCGSGKPGHPYDLGHNFVPMGCTCGYADAEQRKKRTQEGTHE